MIDIAKAIQGLDADAQFVITGSPSKLKEQLDKLYHDINNGTLTTSGGFFTALDAVKTKYPKE